MPPKPVAAYTDFEDLDPTPGVELLEAGGFTVRFAGSDAPDVIAATAGDADVLMVGQAVVDEKLLRLLPSLKVVSLASEGYDNVDLDACAHRGVQVARLPPVATEEVALHAWTLSLALVRQLPFFSRVATWLDRPECAPRRLSELTVGVVGTGRTAEQFVAYATGHVAALRSYSRSGRRLAGAEAAASLEELLEVSDLVSLHLPLDQGTHHLVDDRFLAAMRQRSYLVNVARGSLVDSEALARALDTGHLAGAALDVLDQEPPGSSHPLVGRSDVLVTPHIAYLSDESARRYVVDQATNVIAWSKSGSVSNPAPTKEAGTRHGHH